MLVSHGHGRTRSAQHKFNNLACQRGGLHRSIIVDLLREYAFVRSSDRCFVNSRWKEFNPTPPVSLLVRLEISLLGLVFVAEI